MTSVIESVLTVLTAIAGWFVDAITDMLAIFYTTEGGLTVLGVLATVGVGIGIILLVCGLIQRFFSLRA